MTSWRKTHESQSSFFHEKTQHDGTGQSVVNVEKPQKRSSMNVTENDEKHSLIWGVFMSVTLESAVFMGKNYLDNCHSITNTKDLTLKQMFDISARLVSEQDEISGMETIGW